MTAVEALRAKDAAFNQQMAEVQRRLVAAGLSDLGNGKLATQVSFGPLRSFVEAPQGGLYICTQFDRRVWWLRPDGYLVAVVGNGTEVVDPSLEGKTATAAGYAIMRGMTVDPAGPLVEIAADRLEGRLHLGERRLGVGRGGLTLGRADRRRDKYHRAVRTAR